MMALLDAANGSEIISFVNSNDAQRINNKESITMDSGGSKLLYVASGTA